MQACLLKDKKKKLFIIDHKFLVYSNNIKYKSEIESHQVKKIINILGILVIAVCSIKAQDPQFSQFYSVPAYLAPSFAGSSNGDRVILNYRNQWPGVPNTFETYSLSYDMNLMHYKSGVGAIVMRDQMSQALAKTNVGLQYAYIIFLSKHRINIRPGLTFYYFNLNYNANKIVLGHQIQGRDVTLPVSTMPAIKTVNRFDFNASVIVFTETMWFGYAMDHLTRANESLTNTESITPLKFTFFGGYKFDFNKNSLLRWPERSVSVTFLYKKQEKYDQLDLGVYWTHQPITLGMWYRGIPVKNVANKIDQDAIIVLAGVRINQFKLAYSYDVSISSIFLQSKGSHEITLTWEIPYRGPRKKITAMPCPQI
jgi:type IX secretion system PorP/SprF family membrane protein